MRVHVPAGVEVPLKARRWSVAVAMSFVLSACGAEEIDYQSPEAMNADRRSAEMKLKLAHGDAYELVPWPVPTLPISSDAEDGGAPAVSKVVGSRADDLWIGARGNHVYHYDGATWTEVPLPAPANTGLLTVDRIASAGRGKLWIAHEYGVVRVDPSGATEDFSAQFDSLENPAVAANATSAFVQGGGWIYAFDGSGFVKVRGGVHPSLSVDRDGKLWLIADWGTVLLNGTERTEFGRIASGYPDLGVVTFGDGRAMSFRRAGQVCPSWCHPGKPPFDQTFTEAWTGQALGFGSAARVSLLSIPPPEDLDPAMSYFGEGAQRDRDGKLALVGCVKSATDARGHYVVHIWDGEALHARPIAATAECLDNHPPSKAVTSGSESHYSRPLLDGTWVLSTPSAFAMLLAP